MSDEEIDFSIPSLPPNQEKPDRLADQPPSYCFNNNDGDRPADAIAHPTHPPTHLLKKPSKDISGNNILIYYVIYYINLHIMYLYVLLHKPIKIYNIIIV